MVGSSSPDDLLLLLSAILFDFGQVSCGSHKFVDEQAALLRPLRVDGVVDSAVVVGVGICLALCVPLVSVVGIQQPGFLDLVLDALLM